MTFDFLEEISYSTKLRDLEINYDIIENYRPLRMFFEKNNSVENMFIRKIKVYDRFEFMIGL